MLWCSKMEEMESNYYQTVWIWQKGQPAKPIWAVLADGADILGFAIMQSLLIQDAICTFISLCWALHNHADNMSLLSNKTLNNCYCKYSRCCCCVATVLLLFHSHWQWYTNHQLCSYIISLSFLFSYETWFLLSGHMNTPITDGSCQILLGWYMKCLYMILCFM